MTHTTQTTQTEDQTTIPDEHINTVRFIREAMAQDGMDWRTEMPSKGYCIQMALASGREKCGSTLGLKLRQWAHYAPAFPDQELWITPALSLNIPDVETHPPVELPEPPDAPTVAVPSPDQPQTDHEQPQQPTDQTADRPDQTTQTEQQTTDQPDQTDQPAFKTGLSNLRFLPPIASLGLSAIMQVIIVTDLLGNALSDRYESMGQWAFAIAGLFGLGIACALEGSAAYILDLYKKHLLARDSTIALRVLLIVYVSGSAALIHWWTDRRELPWELALVLSLLAGSSIVLWTMGSKWENRARMRENGQIDEALPRMSTSAKFWHPVRWIQTLWLTSWTPVQTTAEARERYAVWHADRQTKKADHKNAKND